MDIHQLLGLDVQSAFLEEFSREAGREGLSEFKMSSGKRKGRAVAIGGFLHEDGIAMDEDSACPNQEFLPALKRSEHRVPPRHPGAARRPGRPTGPPRDTTPRT